MEVRHQSKKKLQMLSLGQYFFQKLLKVVLKLVMCNFKVQICIIKVWIRYKGVSFDRVPPVLEKVTFKINALQYYSTLLQWRRFAFDIGGDITPPPSRGQKALLKSTGTISCICSSSIQDATHRVVHTLYWRSHHLPPSPHHLEFTEKPMQCNMYKKVTIHVWYHLKCLSAPGKMVSFSQS